MGIKGEDEWAFQNLIKFFFRKFEPDTFFPDDDFQVGKGGNSCRRFKREEMRADQTAFYQACLDSGFDDTPDHNAPDASG
ncbi:MAG: hypothetical protein CM1200mP22_25960 [Dehalococcoidia bacterium]|nr:MAG: hypothetical protein CM1200mP22_25960 [Dehalococcoidia bacterium]